MRNWRITVRGGVGVAALLGLVAATLVALPAHAETEPGTLPDTVDSQLTATTAADPGGLQVLVNERGRISRSVDGTAGGNLTVTKPAGATVRGAYLAVASTGATYQPLSQPVQLAGTSVPLSNEVATGINSFNYFADVTHIVKPLVDTADAGPVSLPVSEPEPSLTDGETLVVIYDDPSVTTAQSVTVLYGALNPSGDVYRVNLAEPVDLSEPDTKLEMSLGISYSYQGGSQYSYVDVNGQRLTSAAGGQDDGFSSNGGLITVGGEGDATANPANPAALPTSSRSDDELYDLRPFVSTGDRTIEVRTSNPSLDDNVFLAVFAMNPPATIATGELPVDPQVQEAPLGDRVLVRVGPHALTFLTNYRAEVLLGANVGKPVTFECVLCLGSEAAEAYLSLPADAVLGQDTIRIWDDTNGNGIYDPEEVFGTTTVRWNEPVHAVGMGDSYSAGEGVRPYDVGTDDSGYGPNRNRCHRSEYAYARQTQPTGYRDSLYHYATGAAGGSTDTRLDFVACSSATTENVIRSEDGGEAQPGEPDTQLGQNKLDGDTDLVTLTIGGNDIKFGPLLTKCSAGPDCTSPAARVHGQPVVDYARKLVHQVLPDDLEEALKAIRAEAPNATVVLLGYPRLFPGPGGDPGCLKLKLWSIGEQTMFNTVAGELDQVMANAAYQAGVHYVSVQDHFAGHAPCDLLEEWVEGPTVPSIPELFHGTFRGSGSFHPNYAGQTDGYAAVLNGWLREASERFPTHPTGLPVNPDQPATAFASTAAAVDEGPVGDLRELHLLPAPGLERSACLDEGLVRPGAPARVVGDGFAPGSTVTLSWDASTHMVDSTPLLLGTAVADTSGWIDTVVTVPPAALDSYALVLGDGEGELSEPVQSVALAGVARDCPVSGYDFTGFFAPVNNLPTVNTTKAGRTVPVKFSLGGDQGLEVFADGSPTTTRVSCDSGAVSDELEQTETAGQSELSYDADTGRYVYTWKTREAWAGTCRMLTVTFADGTRHSALFSFR